MRISKGKILGLLIIFILVFIVIKNNRYSGYRLVPVTDKVTVHFYKPDNWQSAYIYYYNGEVTGPIRPGMEMTHEEGNWYCFIIADWPCADVFFYSHDGEQIPELAKSALRVSGEVWYKDGVLYSEKPEDYQKKGGEK